MEVLYVCLILTWCPASYALGCVTMRRIIQDYPRATGCGLACLWLLSPLWVIPFWVFAILLALAGVAK